MARRTAAASIPLSESCRRYFWADYQERRFLSEPATAAGSSGRGYRCRRRYRPKRCSADVKIRRPHRLALVSYDVFRQGRGSVQILRRFASGVDDSVNPFDLLGVQVGNPRQVRRRDAVISAVEAEIHFFERQRKIELLLRLLERISIGGGRPVLDLAGDAEICG